MSFIKAIKILASVYIFVLKALSTVNTFNYVTTLANISKTASNLEKKL